MKAIELQPLGDAEPDVLESICPALHEAFGVAARVRGTPFPIDPFYNEQRGQYNSTAILHQLCNCFSLPPADTSFHPNNDVCVIGITQRDLFIPILTYVFGEAALGGHVAVVSYHRFRNELYGLSPNRQLVIERLRKVAIHELGHTLGLVHCTHLDCVMHAASYVEELDLKGHEFCPSCSNAIPKRPHR
jgi:archaemetzincin